MSNEISHIEFNNDLQNVFTERDKEVVLIQLPKDMDITDLGDSLKLLGKKPYIASNDKYNIESLQIDMSRYQAFFHDLINNDDLILGPKITKYWTISHDLPIAEQEYPNIIVSTNR